MTCIPRCHGWKSSRCIPLRPQKDPGPTDGRGSRCIPLPSSAYLLKSSRYIRLARMEEFEVYTLRRARGVCLYNSSSLYDPALTSSRCIPLRSQDDPRFRMEGLEVHTSTLQGDGSRARGAYLQKSSHPEEPEVHTSRRIQSPRCKPLQELEVYAFRRAPRMERARGAYLCAPTNYASKRIQCTLDRYESHWSIQNGHPLPRIRLLLYIAQNMAGSTFSSKKYHARSRGNHRYLFVSDRPHVTSHPYSTLAPSTTN